MSKAKKQWERKYDKTCDHLFVGEYPMYRNARLIKLSDDDVMFYVDEDGEIRGIFIEYYEYDLHKKIKKFIKPIFKYDKNKRNRSKK